MRGFIWRGIDSQARRLASALFPRAPRFDGGNCGAERDAQQHSDPHVMNSSANCDSDRNPNAYPFCFVHARNSETGLPLC